MSTFLWVLFLVLMTSTMTTLPTASAMSLGSLFPPIVRTTAPPTGGLCDEETLQGFCQTCPYDLPYCTLNLVGCSWTCHPQDPLLAANYLHWWVALWGCSEPAIFRSRPHHQLLALMSGFVGLLRTCHLQEPTSPPTTCNDEWLCGAAPGPVIPRHQHLALMSDPAGVAPNLPSSGTDLATNTLHWWVTQLGLLRTCHLQGPTSPPTPCIDEWPSWGCSEPAIFRGRPRHQRPALISGLAGVTQRLPFCGTAPRHLLGCCVMLFPWTFSRHQHPALMIDVHSGATWDLSSSGLAPCYQHSTVMNDLVGCWRRVVLWTSFSP